MASIRRNGINYSGGGGGGNTNYKEITLAEYEALGDKVNTDGVLYFITDVNGVQNDALAWKLLGTVTGKTCIPLPTEDFSELMILVMNSTNSLRLTMNVIKGMFPNADETAIFVLGADGGDGYTSLKAYLNINGANGIKIHNVYYGSATMSECGDTCKLLVCYR